MDRKRSRLDIVMDMLSSVQEKGGEIKPTHLMYKSNLAHGQMKSYLEELIGKNLLRKVARQKSEYIIITDDGSLFLQKLREMRRFEETFGL